MINAFGLVAMPNGKNAMDITAFTFQDYYYRLAMLAQTRYKWNGLPNNIDERHVERFLFNEGRCMFFRDKTVGWMVAKCAEAGSLNYYDDPTTLLPVATNFAPDTPEAYENGESAVLILNNDYARPTAHTIMLYAARLTELQRTADINIHAQKTPVILKTTEKQRLSAKSVYNQWNGFEPLIIADKAIDEGITMEAIRIDAPVVFDKLTIEKNRTWQECMTFLGIDNANTDKRERLVDDEVRANNQQIEMSAEVMLKARQRAAEQMSKLCGCKITVELRDVQKPAEAAQDGEKEGGEE